MATKLTPDWHKQQIDAYTAARHIYKTYADALKRVFQAACANSIPEALVQTREKSIASFAEKCVRKFEKYSDPVHQFTDLCGARVIVQTLEHVKAVKLFIEQNFKIEQRDDKAQLLSEDKFGYRDMHYLVRLKPSRALLIGFSQQECDAIENRIAEVQVRSLVQHAWADTLHDRMYKAPLRLSAEAKRTGALLAAVMEDGDRHFDRLASELDGMAANYIAYASPADVQREIEMLELILANENRLRVALQLARLRGPCGDYGGVLKILTPFATDQSSLRGEWLLEMGNTLCHVHRTQPQSAEYREGQKYLGELLQQCAGDDFKSVPNLRKLNSLHAHAHSRLAWSWEVVPGNESKALEHHRAALELEPGNPYHLANQLGFEIYCRRNASVIHSMRTSVRRAIETCREHTLAGTELPYAFFTGGRLQLLLGDGNAALCWYARGLRYLFDGKSCVPVDVLEDEVQWIRRIHLGESAPATEYGWIKRLITLARKLHSQCALPGGKCDKTEVAPSASARRVLILAGGAASMEAETLNRVRPLMEAALMHFEGKVISGATKAGVPGCAGEIAARLKGANQKHFDLVGYRPQYLPDDAPRDERYDSEEVFPGDKGFSPEQILRTWEDLIHNGVQPLEVQLLGFGGGTLTAVEYHVALALGATVGVVRLTDDDELKMTLTLDNAAAAQAGKAEAIACDPFWAGTTSLYPLPCDFASIRAFITSPTHQFTLEELEKMAVAFHECYLRDNKKKLPDNLRPWPDLLETYRAVNREQARYAVEILRAAGFEVRLAKGPPRIYHELKPEDIERMAELEHGRWNVERLRNGWRSGKPRDDEKKIHDCLVPWSELPENIRDYDRHGVSAFPEILAKAGLEISRK